MHEIGWGFDVWNGWKILVEDGVEGFKFFWGRCLEEDEVEVFGSLNLNFTCCSTLDSLKRDFRIHIAIGFSFLFDDLERIYSMMNFGTHTYLVVFFLDMSFDFMPLCRLEETRWSSFLDGFLNFFFFLYWTFKLLSKDLGLVEEEGGYNRFKWVGEWKGFKDMHLRWSLGNIGDGGT